jgi:VanZ family protein
MLIPFTDWVRRSSMPVLIWTVLTTTALLAPASSLPTVASVICKEVLATAIHGILFLGLGFLALVRVGGSHRIAVVICCAMYGLALELLQTTVPGRAFQLSDIIANSMGSALALLLASDSGEE